VVFYFRYVVSHRDLKEIMVLMGNCIGGMQFQILLDDVVGDITWQQSPLSGYSIGLTKTVVIGRVKND